MEQVSAQVGEKKAGPPVEMKGGAVTKVPQNFNAPCFEGMTAAYWASAVWARHFSSPAVRSQFGELFFHPFGLIGFCEKTREHGERTFALCAVQLGLRKCFYSMPL